MAKGKFSTPREHRDEERQIEASFRQLTDRPSQASKTVSPLSLQADSPERSSRLQDSPASSEDSFLFQDSPAPSEDSFLFQDSPAFSQAAPSYTQPVVPPKPRFSLDSIQEPEDSPFAPSGQAPSPRAKIPSRQDEADFYAFLDEALSPSKSQRPATSAPPTRNRPRPASSPQSSRPAAAPQQPRTRPASSQTSRSSGNPPKKSYAAAQVKRVTGHDPEPDEQDTDFLDNLAVFWRKYQKQVLLGITVLALIILAGLAASTFLSSADPYDGVILNNVYLADINVGGMTKSQAVSALKSATAASYSGQDMVINLGTRQIRLSPQDTGVKLNVNDAVAAAFSYGRTGTQDQQQQDFTSSQTEIHTIGLLPYLQMNTDVIRQTLSSYAQEIGSTLTQPSASLEGSRPQLATDRFDPNTPGETLVITMGTPGVGFDVEAAYKEVLDAYSLHRFQVYVEASDTTQEPQQPNLEELYQQYYLAPVDDKMDMQTYQTVPGSYGVSFDLNQAKSLIAQADYGQAVRIPLIYTPPEKTGNSVLFQDVMGECQTKHNSDERRNTNLRLACAALDGLILQPGQLFSYNEALGERTAEKGYQPAPAYSGLGLVDSIGGGICQGSSTLYNCVLLADLEVVERLCHGFTVSYLPMGLDATVSWGFADFKFRNTSNFPIMIKAEVSDGYMKMKILGTDERNYYVKMESTYSVSYEPETIYQEYYPDNPEGYYDGKVLEAGTTGYYARSYKVKYDKVTNQQISREVEDNSSYIKVDRVVVRIVPKPTEPKPTEPKPTDPPKPAESKPTEPPAPPATEAPSPPATQPPSPPATEPPSPPATEPPSPPATQPPSPPATEPPSPPATQPPSPPATEPPAPPATEPPAPPASGSGLEEISELEGSSEDSV